MVAPDTAAYYAARNGSTDPPVTRQVEQHAGERIRVERTDYQQTGHPPVTLYTMHGCGHVIPAPRPVPHA